MRKSDPFHRKPKQKPEPSADVPGDARQALNAAAGPSILSHSNTPQVAQASFERALDAEDQSIATSSADSWHIPLKSHSSTAPAPPPAHPAPPSHGPPAQRDWRQWTQVVLELTRGTQACVQGLHDHLLESCELAREHRDLLQAYDELLQHHENSMAELTLLKRKVSGLEGPFKALEEILEGLRAEAVEFDVGGGQGDGQGVEGGS